jgi:hypothetical protein
VKAVVLNHVKNELIPLRKHADFLSGEIRVRAAKKLVEEVA